MLCFCLSLFDLIASKGLRLREKPFCLRFVLFSAAVFALRSNGFVVVVVSVLVAFLLCSQVRKRAAILGFGSLVGLFVVQAIALNAFSIAPAHFSESVALPLQQIAKTVVDDGNVSEEQAAFIDEVIPLEELESVYRPDTPNPIKFSPEFNDDFLESHKVEFLTVWIQLLPSNFGAYVSAWLHETTGFGIRGSTVGLWPIPAMRCIPMSTRGRAIFCSRRSPTLRCLPESGLRRLWRNWFRRSATLPHWFGLRCSFSS